MPAMRLHLVDGTYELYRHHFSKRPEHLGRDGRTMKATVGVLSSILYLLHDAEEAVTHIAVAFDNPIRSFRNDLFAGYKGDAGVPPELHAQFDDVERAMGAIGVTVWSMRDFEADDGLAAGAAAWANHVDQVRIMTPDKDLGQCVRGQRVVQVDRRRETVLDEAGVHAKFGVGPASIPDLLALKGDAADGIPGIPGFGAKSAALLLARYVHLDAIPESAAAWDVKVRGAERLAHNLAAQREDALLYRRLATLREDAPISANLEDLTFQGVPRERYLAWCDALAVDGGLRERPTRWAL